MREHSLWKADFERFVALLTIYPTSLEAGREAWELFSRLASERAARRKRPKRRMPDR